MLYVSNLNKELYSQTHKNISDIRAEDSSLNRKIARSIVDKNVNFYQRIATTLNRGYAYCMNCFNTGIEKNKYYYRYSFNGFSECVDKKDKNQILEFYPSRLLVLSYHAFNNIHKIITPEFKIIVPYKNIKHIWLPKHEIFEIAKSNKYNYKFKEVLNISAYLEYLYGLNSVCYDCDGTNIKKENVVTSFAYFGNFSYRYHCLDCKAISEIFIDKKITKPYKVSISYVRANKYRFTFHKKFGPARIELEINLTKSFVPNITNKKETFYWNNKKIPKKYPIILDNGEISVDGKIVEHIDNSTLIFTTLFDRDYARHITKYNKRKKNGSKRFKICN